MAGTGHALQAILLGQTGFFGVVQHQAAAFGRRDVLVRLEAERHQVTQGTDLLAVPFRTQGLGRVFDDAQVVFLGDGVQAVHVHRQAGQVNRDDRLGARGDGRLDLVQVDIAGHRVDIGEHRGRADFDDHVGGGDPGDWRGDHFVARADTGDAQGDFHGAGAGVEGAHRTSAEVFRQLRFKGRDLRTAGDPAGAQDIAHGGNGRFVDGRFGKRQERKFAHGVVTSDVKAGSALPAVKSRQQGCNAGDDTVLR